MRASTAALALLLTALTGCAAQPTQAELETRCATAIANRAKGDTAKPAACEALTQDDYETLVIGHGLSETGIVDKDGHINPQRLLGATATPEPPADE
ncbi:hypothetical protein [Streptomyces triculaminicus]|uniref:hypothetical protein n=1 Tax=Streptomyces triculaminicus TaxID=2816232 RepID=UPI0037B5B57B